MPGKLIDYYVILRSPVGGQMTEVRGRTVFASDTPNWLSLGAAAAGNDLPLGGAAGTRLLPGEATVRLIDVSTRRQVAVTRSDPLTGEFLFVAVRPRELGYVIHARSADGKVAFVPHVTPSRIGESTLLSLM